MIDVRRVAEAWRRADVTVRDLPLALLLIATAFTPSLRGHGTQLGDLPTRPFDLLAAAAVALECLPLAVRRRWPAGCLALVGLAFAVDQLRGYHTTAGTALPLAVISAGAHLERGRRPYAVLASLAFVPLAVALWRGGSTEGVSGFVTFYLVLVIAWGAGAWLRTTRAAEADRRSQVARATRLAERTRIAGELHDVVTHHVTAMVVQAEAARYLTASPERLDGALTAVTDTGRRAISDLRQLLDLLNPDHGTDHGTDHGPGHPPRVPSLGGLDALVEQTRRAGQPVELVQDGVPTGAGGSAELAAYRVVQEALTNALKYARGIPTTVRVHHGEQEITVEVGTAGPGPDGASPGGSGRGLAGLDERVGLLGGEFSAGRRSGGGFVVRARIPTADRP